MARPRQALNVAVGEKLGFARELERNKVWPPSRIRRSHRDAPPATPYLVIPADPNDAGARPLPGAEALHSAGIEFVTTTGSTVPIPKAGQEYRLRATIRNLGAAPSYAGVAEFALAYPSAIEAAAAGAGTVPPHGIEGFIVQSGQTITVTCRRPWKPLKPDEAENSVVVQAYDALLDPIARRFDARSDRHVGRKDSLPDFAGTWEGRQFFAAPLTGNGLLYRVVIAQTDLNVDVSIFAEVSGIPGTPIGVAPSIGVVGPHIGGPPLIGGPPTHATPTLPAAPQLTGTGTIVNRQVQLSITEMLALNGPGTTPVPFTDNLITLTLPDPDTLHVTTHTTFVAPGDPRGPQDLVADLKRN
jgi:hypothetical protein